MPSSSFGNYLKTNEAINQVSTSDTHKTLITTIRAVSQLSTVFLFPVGERWEGALWTLLKVNNHLKLTGKKYAICKDKMIYGKVSTL